MNQNQPPKNATDDNTPVSEREKEHQILLALGQSLIKRDERNELWKKIERLGTYLMQKARRGFFRG